MGGYVLPAGSSLARACSARSSSSGIMPWDSRGEDCGSAFLRGFERRRRKRTSRAIARTTSPTPTPMPTFAPVLRPPALFVDVAVELVVEAETGMEEARDEERLLVVVGDEVSDGAAVFRDMGVPVAVALVVTAIVYPASE